MVKVAIAGPGQLALEVIDGLVATGKHEIVILSRRDATPEQVIEGTTWVKVDYLDKSALVKALQGVHTVLSFIVVNLDQDCQAQKNLIDAAIEVGAKRFAPSEWAVARLNHLEDWYGNKQVIRDYLEEKNKDKKVIEYTLFQTGWWMHFLAGKHRVCKHCDPATGPIDYENRRALVPSGEGHRTTYTTVEDIVAIVVRAVDYEGEWPKVGGINGTTMTIEEEIALAEKVRGKPFKAERLDVQDLKAGELKSSWALELGDVAHLEGDTRLHFSKLLTIKMLLHTSESAGVVSDEWNQIFPDYKFTTAEELVTRVWAGKP
ncbi:hypothetical protein VTK26DRAFT_9149 [Humicola hyalothermophila]